MNFHTINRFHVRENKSMESRKLENQLTKIGKALSICVGDKAALHFYLDLKNDICRCDSLEIVTEVRNRPSFPILLL